MAIKRVKHNKYEIEFVKKVKYNDQSKLVNQVI